MSTSDCICKRTRKRINTHISAKAHSSLAETDCYGEARAGNFIRVENQAWAKKSSGDN